MERLGSTDSDSIKEFVMGLLLAEYFDKLDQEGVALGEARLVLRLGITRQRAQIVEDTPDLMAKAEDYFQQIMETKNLFGLRR
jgi:hypothetical protein